MSTGRSGLFHANNSDCDIMNLISNHLLQKTSQYQDCGKHNVNVDDLIPSCPDILQISAASAVSSACC